MKDETYKLILDKFIEIEQKIQSGFNLTSMYLNCTQHRTNLLEKIIEKIIEKVVNKNLGIFTKQELAEINEEYEKLSRLAKEINMKISKAKGDAYEIFKNLDENEQIKN